MRIHNRVSYNSVYAYAMAILQLLLTFCRCVTTDRIALVRRQIYVRSAYCFQVGAVGIVVRANSRVLSSLILMTCTDLREITIAQFPFRPGIYIPFVLVGASRVSRNLLPIRFRRLRHSLLVSVRSLPSIEFMAAYLSM